MLTTLFVAAVLTLLAKPAAAQAAAPVVVALPTADIPADLDRVLRDYESAWRARDGARLAQLFTEDGFVLSSESMPVRGRPAIADRYEHAGGPLHLRPLAYAAAERVGYVVGAYGVRPDREAGKFVLALRRERAGNPWQIAADIDNSNIDWRVRSPASETVVRALFDEAWSAGNYATLSTLLAPDLQFHFRGRGRPMTADQFKGMVEMWRTSFPDLQFKVEDIVSNGDRVAARFTFTGTHQKELMRIPATGKKVSVTMMGFFRMQDGKIAEIWEDYDEAGMRQQLTAEGR